MYEDWAVCGQALADNFADAGRELFHVLSCESAKYQPDRTERDYNYFLRNPKRCTLDIIYNRAKFHGIIVKERYQSKLKPSALSQTIQAVSVPVPEPTAAEKIAQLQSMFDLEFTAYNGETLKHDAIQRRINTVYGCDLTHCRMHN